VLFNFVNLVMLIPIVFNWELSITYHRNVRFHRDSIFPLTKKCGLCTFVCSAGCSYQHLPASIWRTHGCVKSTQTGYRNIAVSMQFNVFYQNSTMIIILNKTPHFQWYVHVICSGFYWCLCTFYNCTLHFRCYSFCKNAKLVFP